MAGAVRAVRERLVAWWSARGDREKRLLRALALALAAALALSILWRGAEAALEARAKLRGARQALESARAEAAALPSERRELERARARWDAAKTRLWRDAETGIALRDAEEAARSSGARLLRFEPTPRADAFYRGHLRAVPVKVKLGGTFPAALSALERLERLANPGEIRSLKIEAREPKEGVPPGWVEADAVLVLYSLNPPEIRGAVPGVSGRYDPFFPLVIPEEPAEGHAAAAEAGAGKAGPPEGPAPRVPAGAEGSPAADAAGPPADAEGGRGGSGPPVPAPPEAALSEPAPPGSRPPK